MQAYTLPQFGWPWPLLWVTREFESKRVIFSHFECKLSDYFSICSFCIKDEVSSISCGVEVLFPVRSGLSEWWCVNCASGCFKSSQLPGNSCHVSGWQFVIRIDHRCVGSKRVVCVGRIWTWSVWLWSMTLWERSCPALTPTDSALWASFWVGTCSLPPTKQHTLVYPQHTLVHPQHTCSPTAHTCSPTAHTCSPTAHTCLPTAHTCSPTAHTCSSTAHTCSPTAHTCLPTAHTCLPTTHLFTPSTHLFTPSTHLFTHSTHLFTHSTHLFTHSTHLFTHNTHLFTTLCGQ